MVGIQTATEETITLHRKLLYFRKRSLKTYCVCVLCIMCGIGAFLQQLLFNDAGENEALNGRLAAVLDRLWACNYVILV